MTSDQWRAFLKRTSERLLDIADPYELERAGKEAVAARWLGYPPASDAAIAKAERRLSVRLPPSYRAFLKTSNGWPCVEYWPHGVCSLVPIEELKRFVVVDKRIGALDAYLRDVGNIPPEQRSPNWRAPEAELRDSLAVGVGDGNEYILLAPAVQDDGGEWRVWTYDHEEGFFAYDSFAAFMEDA